MASNEKKDAPEEKKGPSVDVILWDELPLGEAKLVGYLLPAFDEEPESQSKILAGLRDPKKSNLVIWSQWNHDNGLGGMMTLKDQDGLLHEANYVTDTFSSAHKHPAYPDGLKILGRMYKGTLYTVTRLNRNHAYVDVKAYSSDFMD